MAKYRKLGRTSSQRKALIKKPGNSTSEQRKNRYNRS